VVIFVSMFGTSIQDSLCIERGEYQKMKELSEFVCTVKLQCIVLFLYLVCCLSFPLHLS